MPNMLKHIGRLVKNNRKVVVAYKVVPNEPEQCIVVTTENLMADEHDALMRLVESHTGQEADDLATAMARSSLPDGKNMLSGFHQTGKMIKVPTNEVEMIPTNNSSIKLNELNEVIAQQRGVTVNDLAINNGQQSEVKDVSATEPQTVNKVADQYSPEKVEQLADNNDPLSDDELAKRYRSQANAMFKEAKRLREEAEKLAPTKQTKNASTAKEPAETKK